jgi:hypothetical protein
MDDSDRNILASLAHEACENCATCGDHVCPMPVGPTSWVWEYANDDNEPICETCACDPDPPYRPHPRIRTRVPA